MNTHKIVQVFCFALVPAAVTAAVPVSKQQSVSKILAATGVKGGLVVVLSCDSPEQIVELRANDSYLIQALDTDPAKVAKAREYIQSKGFYGKVSVDTFDGKHLPYVDNCVNAIVVSRDTLNVERGEIERVLAPRGVAVFPKELRSSSFANHLRQGFGGQEATADKQVSAFSPQSVGDRLVFRKPVPTDIDDWSHNVHGPDGNPVARDRVVGPPKRMQWQAGPRWSRAHDSDSSIDAMVTAGGRIFYMADEAPASLLGFNDLPDKWVLTARDAFNGVLLWKRPIKNWGWRAWKDDWYKGRADTFPRNIHRRVVATEDKLYVTLGFHAAVSELDAATGKVLQTYAGTERTREILYQNGQLVLTIPENEKNKLVMLDPVTGKVNWETKAIYAGASTERQRVRMKEKYSVLNAAVDNDLVCIMDGKDLVCLDRKTGKDRWRTAPRPEGKGLWTGTLITSDGVVLYSEPRLLIALSAKDGKKLWILKTAEFGGLWFSWKDVFVIDGLVWTWSPEREGKPVAANGYDIKTGELKKTMPTGNIFNVDHHHRCYRNKATLRYIIASRRGAEYVDLEEGKHSVNIWVRGICFLGMMPANGFLYAPPHPCKCYLNEKLNGFCALAGKTTDDGRQITERLEKGPAYSEDGGQRTEDSEKSGWLTFRGDAARSGSSSAKISSGLKQAWQADIGGRLTSPTVADGKLFIAQVDAHTVHALDAVKGKKIWSFTSGGRVDSPPTYYKGTVLFGSVDGWVHCLRASDGELVWKFRAAPRDRLVCIYSQLESAWPVHGSVLVDEETVYFAAGRSSYLDGGIHVYGLNAVTGEMEHHTVIDGPHVDASKPDWYAKYNTAFGLGTISDILQAAEGRICMGNKVFDRKLGSSDVLPERIRLMGGMLDDSQYRRTFWFYGREMTSSLHMSLNYRPKKPLLIKHGRSDMLVHDTRSLYGVRRFDNTRLLNAHNHFVPGKGDLLFAVGKGQEESTWESRIPVRVRSMLVASDQLVIAGPPEEEVDPKDPLGTYEGRKGGVLWTVSAATGEKIKEYKLEAPPVFNGLAAANGWLYWSTTDGKVICYGGKK